jgi:hypothetical protein
MASVTLPVGLLDALRQAGRFVLLTGPAALSLPAMVAAL